MSARPFRISSSSLISGLFGLRPSRSPEPMTNAGRYLQQLDGGDMDYALSHTDESPCSEELLAGLRRIQITSAKELS